MVVLHDDAKVAELALAAAFAELELVEELMSIYRPDSQLSRLNRDGRLADPHPHLVEVLRKAQSISEFSGGAFDITVQPLWALYAARDRAGRRPTAEEVAEARQLVDYRQVYVGQDEVRLESPGMAVTLNGIAQGFAADHVARTLADHGIQHALVNTGEFVGMGSRAGAAGWKVGLQHPRENRTMAGVAQLQGRALATSGDYQTTFFSDPRTHHIFDPATGCSPAEVASVSVVAETAMTADALSTAAFVLGPTRTMRLLEQVHRAEVMFVLKDGRTLHSAGFPFA